MKKLFAILFSLLLLLSLTACGGGNEETPAESGGSQTADPNSFGGDLLAKIQAGQSAGWQEVTEDQPFGQYHTEEELLAMLESGDFSAYEVTFEEAAEPVVVTAEETGGEAFTYDPMEGVTGTFSEAEGAGKVKGGVTYWDWRSELSEEDLAEWDAHDPNDPETQAMMEDLERQSADAQQQLDEVTGTIDMDEINRQMEEALKEAQKELEGVELPEGYEDLLGGLDLSGLAGGLSDSLTGGGYEGETYGWPDGLRVYQGGAKTSCAEGSIAIYATTMEEMRAYVNLLKQDGFVYMDFYDSGMTEEQMLKSVEQWHGTNGTLYLEIGYGFGDLGLGYGESGTVTIEYTYKKPSWDDIW